jgi:hypothetical protein
MTHDVLLAPADNPMALMDSFADVIITEAMPNSLRGRLILPEVP